MDYLRLSFDLADISLFLKRLYLGKVFLKKSILKVRINKKEKFTKFISSEFKNLDKALVDLNKIKEKRLAAIDLLEIKKNPAIKTFYLNLLTKEDLFTYPSIMEFALSDELLTTLTDYYKMLPLLSHVALFASGLDDDIPKYKYKRRGTQNLHSDNHDLKHVKLFCYLEDVELEDGPLTILSYEKSSLLLKIKRKLWNRSPFRNDEEYSDLIKDKDFIPLIGKANEGFIVDTTKLMHYGSRCEKKGTRFTFVLHYTLSYKYADDLISEDFSDNNLRTMTDLKTHLQPLNKFKDLVFRVV